MGLVEGLGGEEVVVDVGAVSGDGGVVRVLVVGQSQGGGQGHCWHCGLRQGRRWRGLVAGLQSRGSLVVWAGIAVMWWRWWWWWWLVFINGNDLFFVHWNLHWFGNRNWIGDFHWDWDLHVFFADLLNNLSTLLFVRVFLDNFVFSLTFLLKSLNTFFLGNIDGGFIAFSLYSGPINISIYNNLINIIYN